MNIRSPTKSPTGRPNNGSKNDSDNPDAHLRDLEHSELEYSTSLAKAAHACVSKESFSTELMNSFAERPNDSENDSDFDSDDSQKALKHAELESSVSLAKVVNVRVSKEFISITKGLVEKLNDCSEIDSDDLDAHQGASEIWELEPSTASSEAIDARVSKKSSSTSTRLPNVRSSPSPDMPREGRIPLKAEDCIGVILTPLRTIKAFSILVQRYFLGPLYSFVSRVPLLFILLLITWLTIALLFAWVVHQLQVYASLWADSIGWFTEPGLNTLRNVSGAAKAGFC